MLGICFISHKTSIHIKLDGYYCSIKHVSCNKATIQIDGISDYRKNSLESFNGTISFENINSIPDPVTVWIQFSDDSKSGTVLEQNGTLETQDWDFLGAVITDQFDAIIILICDPNADSLYSHYFIAPVESIDSINEIAKIITDHTAFSEFDW